MHICIKISLSVDKGYETRKDTLKGGGGLRKSGKDKRDDKKLKGDLARAPGEKEVVKMGREKNQKKNKFCLKCHK